MKRQDMQDNIIVFPESSPVDTAQLVTHGLPVSLTSLIGREYEVQALHALLLRPDVRLLTITGPAGVGKTRLALEVARDLLHDFANGVQLISLASIRDPVFVIPTIAYCLGLTESGSQSLLDLLKSSQHDKHRLLLLDNFEHVIPAATLLVELLEACPDLKLLVTSREVLYLRGEHQFAVHPLALPDPKRLQDGQSLAHVPAVNLFIQRVQSIQSDFQLTTDNATIIAEICVRLDGLPLAIELAAARGKLLAPQALLARLDRRLHILTGGARDLPERQRTLRNTLTWSYELLTEEEQRLFQRISVFVGGATLEAVEAVCEALGDETGRVFDGMASLMDKSLVQQQVQGDEDPRLLMLETIREYGLELLTNSGERQATQRAHADYYLWLSEEVEHQLWGHQQGRWLQQLEHEHGNLQAALSWFLEQGDARQSIEKALRFGSALRSFWLERGDYSEGRTFLEQVLARSEGIEATVRAKGLSAAATMAYLQGDNDQAELFCRESLMLFQELGNTHGIAYSLHRLGLIASRRSDYQAAQSSHEAALQLFREIDDKEGMAYSLTDLAYGAMDLGDFTRARALAMEGLALFRRLGDKRGTVYALLRLGRVYYFSQGDQLSAYVLVEEALTLSREIGYTWGVTSSLGLLGQLELNRGDVHTARAHLEEALVLRREIGDGWGIAWGVYSLGWVVFEQGDYAAAKAQFLECLAIVRALDDKEFMASDLEALAGVVSVQGNPTWAAQLWGAAETLREAIGAPIAPVNRAMYESLVAAARARLGEQVFTTSWAEGRSMTPEQVLGAPGQAAVSTPISAGQLAIPTTKSSPRYPAGLTVREVEVLCLVAQGLTDAQVAEQLVISPHTVNAHLKSIYGKIHVSSRGAATRYAIEHQLL